MREETTAREVALQAVEEHGAQFIIGAICADAAEGAAQVAMEQGVVLISPTSVDPELTLDNDGNVRWLVFRVPFIDADQGAAAAQFALETLDVETAAILYVEGSAYGTALSNAFAETFEAGGGDVVELRRGRGRIRARLERRHLRPAAVHPLRHGQHQLPGHGWLPLLRGGGRIQRRQW